jgi:hypothetical protein
MTLEHSGDSTFAIALIFPDLLGTYGDSGNAKILAQRLRWRGMAARVLTVFAGDPVPTSCQLYVVGGGEDLPQSLAARQLLDGRPLGRAVAAGAAVLAVCAGLQILGTSFVGPDGVEAAGLDLLDCRTVRSQGPRAVGELVVEPDPSWGLPALTGYENHGGVTLVGPGACPIGSVRTGVGNGTPPSTSSPFRPPRQRQSEGVVSGRIWATYMHGPVLARNPALADLLLGWVAGPLDPLEDSESEQLRAERLRAAPAEASNGVPWRQLGVRHGAGRYARKLGAMLR